MQQAITKWKLGGLLAAFLAVFALAFSFVTAEPALADDDLAAGEMALSTQSATTYPITVNVQYGTATPTKVTTYSATEFSKLKSSSKNYASGLIYDSGKWFVTTAIEYVTLEDLLANANLQWASGASVTVSNGTDSQTFTYDDIKDMKFYPKTESDARNTAGAISTGLVFGLKNTEKATIGDGNTAADTQKAAAGTSVDTNSVLAVSGTLEADYKATSGATVAASRFVDGVNAITVTYPETTKSVYRLYNPNNGDHHYTTDVNERDTLVTLGWNSEGEGWKARVVSNTPVYRLYNPNSGDHHYTTDENEYKTLASIGWNKEGIAWYSDDSKGIELYRLYNSSLTAGTHHYTKDSNERDVLKGLGWVYEGISWYGVA